MDRVSIHAPWEGCDLGRNITVWRVKSFNSRTLGRVRLSIPYPSISSKRVSIHAPWEGCDSSVKFTSLSILCFNSRTLGRVRQKGGASGYTNVKFQFTHPGKGATGRTTLLRLRNGFQFTHPGKGATYSKLSDDRIKKFQFTHPGKGATVGRTTLCARIWVSIHAPWEGCDCALSNCASAGLMFQFTHPGKGATAYDGVMRRHPSVSIHAPWEGCDSSATPPRTTPRSFNSRTLGRVRPREQLIDLAEYMFQFTHPGKGATASGDDCR